MSLLDGGEDRLMVLLILFPELGVSWRRVSYLYAVVTVNSIQDQRKIYMCRGKDYAHGVDIVLWTKPIAFSACATEPVMLLCRTSFSPLTDVVVLALYMLVT